MHLIVGLGNPGDAYANHRHNIGFRAVDAIAKRHGFSPWRQKFSGLIAEGTIDGQRVLLLKPQTFMNKSGDSAAAAVKFYKLSVGDVTVIYDELDLTPGKLRVKTGGGSGGHNGLRSLDASVGNGFHRVRLGIGHPGHKDLVHNHVLGNFAKSDAQWLETLLGGVADNAGLLATGEHANFMNRLALVATEDRQTETPKAAKPKEASHIRQARPKNNPVKVPASGPMASMLKRLFGKDDD